MTDAHEQRTTTRIVHRISDHQPREDDPHYKLFDAYKRELKRIGKWRCVVPGCKSPSPVNLHHSFIEFSDINAMDPAKVAAVFGLPPFADTEAFLLWIESPGNLEPLCFDHHLGKEGVHTLPEPWWNAVRCQLDTLAPVAEVEHQHSEPIGKLE